MIRVMLADDHERVRVALRSIVADEADLEIAGEVGDAYDLPAAIEHSRPDVLVLDITMPGPGFQQTMRRLRERFPALPVLVLSMHPPEQWETRALQAGASAYLDKSRVGTDLVETIRAVRRGGSAESQGS